MAVGGGVGGVAGGLQVDQGAVDVLPLDRNLALEFGEVLVG